jgi:hypothetical protein
MTTEGGNRVRASDAEREQYAKMLRAAMTEGRLTLEEGEERLGRLYEARFRDELPPLTADLPDGGRQALFETPEAQEQFQRFQQHARRHFAGHVGFVTVVTAVLVGLWVLSGAHFFWPAIPLFFLMFGLMRHFRWRRWGGPWRGGPWGGGHPWGGGPWQSREGGPGQRGSWQGGRCGGWQAERRGQWGRDPWAANSDATPRA